MKSSQHSNKLCWCGGHNDTNTKKNKKHNGTKKKLLVRKTRKGLKKLEKGLYQWIM